MKFKCVDFIRELCNLKIISTKTNLTTWKFTCIHLNGGVSQQDLTTSVVHMFSWNRYSMRVDFICMYITS